MTNPTTPELLSDEALKEIEAEIAKRNDATAMESACGEYNCPCHYRLPALCQTVRAAWSDAERLRNHNLDLKADLKQGALCEECERWENNEDGNPRTFMVCGACWNALQKTNATLCEQLAEAQQCHADAEEDLASARLRIGELQERLK